MSSARLYNPEVLALAAGLSGWPYDPAMGWTGSARSASCGSVLAMSLGTDAAGRVDRVGLRAQACAIGQASAAIFAKGAIGATRADIERTGKALADWLTNGGPLPEWPGLDAIAAAAAFPGRHGAILLPWKAALDALPTGDAPR